MAPDARPVRGGGLADYAFVFSNAPAPGLVAKVRVAQQAGRRPLVIFLQRSLAILEVERLPGCHVVAIPVPYRGVELARALVMIQLVSVLGRHFRRDVARGADVYTDALDLLAVVMAAGVGRGFRYRYEVRDLHELQRARGLVPATVRLAERLLLPRLHTLILTSEEYWRQHYRLTGAHGHVVVENVPTRESWSGFRRLPHDGMRIGFVGVLRFLPCLEVLVRVVRRLRAGGADVRVRFAGGGEVAAMRTFCAGDDFAEFTGPYVYGTDIQRLYEDIDVIYSVYDARDPNVRFAMPNKFYESLIAGIPIVVAAGTYLEQRVREVGCGVAVDGLDEEAVLGVLLDAHERRGWYEAAVVRLAEDCATLQFARYEDAIVRAVLD